MGAVHVKFDPYENGGGGGGTSFSHAEGGGGHNKFWGNLYVVAGARKKFPFFKRGAGKFLPCLEGAGAQQLSDPRFSIFVAPPPRNY